MVHFKVNKEILPQTCLIAELSRIPRAPPGMNPPSFLLVRKIEMCIILSIVIQLAVSSNFRYL